MLIYSPDGATKELTAAQQKSPRTALAAARRAKGFLWIGLVDPTESDLAPFVEAFALHPLAVNDAVTGRQQPKIQTYGDMLFIVMWTLTEKRRSDAITVGGVFMFVSDDLFITVQRDAGSDLLDIPHILTGFETPLADGATGAMYGLMTHVGSSYSDLASDVEKELEKLEHDVFDQKSTEDGSRIYRVRQKIGKLERATASIAASLRTSSDHLDSMVVDHADLAPYIRDLIDDFTGTSQLVADQQSSLDGVISSHENNVASKQNVDTRKISAFAALLAVPTVLAGLYGMNFKNLPGVSWAFGWEAVVAAILVCDAILWVGFRRRHWL
jgi:magnesium transporter